MSSPESLWSIEWWKERHAKGYFPTMDWHLDWKICPYPPPNVMELIQPKQEERGLEIGCGYGEWMTPLINECGCILHGIDIHVTLEAKANEKFKEHRATKHCHFTLSDGLTIPYPPSTFDFVYSVSVFQHIPRATVRGYFEETNRVLKRGGRVLFHFRRADNDGPYSQDIGVDHKGDFSTGWTADEALEEAKRVGWKDARTLDNLAHSLFLYAVKP